MARPTRKHPALRIYRSAESRAMLGNILNLLGEIEYRAVARLGPIHVFRLMGPRGTGLLAEHGEALPEPPGVFQSIESAWVRQAGEPQAWVMDGRFHDWDAWAAAEATGDRSAVDGPRKRMYRIRDERTAEAAREDTLAVSAIPGDAVPALMAGLTPERVRALAEEHAPELLG